MFRPKQNVNKLLKIPRADSCCSERIRHMFS
uniref:Uncharacterized protein n=1 Tax=Anguilla anguilla TaxID=7936 RepID=A0A0E9RIL1_ANGAN